MLCKKLYFVLLLLFCFCCLRGQTAIHPQNAYKSFTDNNGLPSKTVYCIHQDVQGYIWFGTDKGVARYDGQHFKYYTGHDGLSDNTVFHIKSDLKGNVWFNTFSGGLSCYSSQTQQISPHPLNDSILDILQNDWIGNWHIDGKGDIWWAPYNRSFEYIAAPVAYQMSHEYIKKHNMYLQGFSNIQKRVSAYYLPDSNILWHNNPRSHLSQFSFLDGIYFEGNFIMGNEKGVCIWDRSGVLQEIITDGVVSKIYIDSKKQIWLSTQKGLLQYSNLEALKFNKTAAIWFEGSNISHFIEDKEGNYWVAAFKQEVRQIPARGLKYYNFLQAISHMESSGNTLWASTQTGNLYQILLNGAADATIARGLPNEYLCNFTFLSADTIFLSSGYHYYPSKASVQKIDYTPTINTIKSFYNAGNGNIWVGHVNGAALLQQGKYRFSATDKGFQRWVDALLLSGDELLMASPQGLYSYFFSDTSTVCWRDTLPALGEWSRALMKDNKGQIWVATQGEGVFCRDIYGRWIQYRSESDLSALFVNALHQSIDGTIWIGTHQGVFCLRDGDKFVRPAFSHLNGLPDNEVFCFWSDSLNLWIGTGKGLAVAPIKYSIPKYTPPFFISQLSCSDTTWLRPSICTLQWQQSSFSIFWTYISFSQSSIEYRYRLLGIDTFWHITQQPIVQYNRLPTGNYDWEVEVRLPNGGWHPHRQRLSLVVLPHWSQSWLFRITIAIAVLLLLAVVVWLRWRTVHRRIENRRQIQESEYKALRSQMNPHFLFNTLNSILYLINADDKKAARSYLSDFSKLMRRVLEQSKQSFIPIREDWDSLMLYIRLEMLRFQHQVQMHFPMGDVPEITSFVIPPMLLQPLVENAFVHGLAPKKDKGNLYLSWRMEQPDLLCVEIEDDGIGRVAAAALRPSNSTATATSNLLARLQLINECYKTHFRLVIDDLYNPQQIPSGTKITLFIPLLP